MAENKTDIAQNSGAAEENQTDAGKSSERTDEKISEMGLDKKPTETNLNEEKQTDIGLNSRMTDQRLSEQRQNSRMTKEKPTERKLKSEPMNGKRDRLIKVRHSFQKRIFTKLGFFNSVRAREKMWGVKKNVPKSLMTAGTADPTATIRSSTPINVFITQEQNTNPLG